MKIHNNNNSYSLKQLHEIASFLQKAGLKIMPYSSLSKNKSGFIALFNDSDGIEQTFTFETDFGHFNEFFQYCSDDDSVNESEDLRVEDIYQKHVMKFCPLTLRNVITSKYPLDIAELMPMTTLLKSNNPLKGWTLSPSCYDWLKDKKLSEFIKDFSYDGINEDYSAIIQLNCEFVFYSKKTNSQLQFDSEELNHSELADSLSKSLEKEGWFPVFDILAYAYFDHFLDLTEKDVELIKKFI